ncbi:unnamed protein product [Phaedon cochleariae]|uniref:AB hydrolase-1 domain-containing protein n=1 Tax=Phaedon cochleariae TaxID=80249 RepID=A0A9P0DXN2_PHACE|nr:unnamed protein product [Phaedon cochleariae]
MNNHNKCNGQTGKEEEFLEVKVPVPWGHIAGKWWGSQDVQPIIAIHGWQDNCGTFDNLAPRLRSRGLSVFCVDLPGHGFSSHIPQGQSYYLFWDGVQYLRRIVKHFDWKNISVIGHSLGGGIAFLYAAIFPNEVEKYVSIDIASPSVRSPKKMVDVLGSSMDKFLAYESKPVLEVPCYDYEDMLDVLVDAHAGSINRSGCEIMLKRGMKSSKNGSGFVFTRDPRLKVSAAGFMTIEQVLEFASRITCEVLNIRASPGLKFDNPEHYTAVLDEMEKSAKRLERQVVEGTHHLHLNDADSVAPIICDFLLA